MIRLPQTSWSQLNNSDKSGAIAYSKNINLDKEGYLRLSPRAVNLFDNSENATNVGDTDFNFPVSFGRYDAGQFRLATTDEPFNVNISDTAKTIAEDTGSNNPNLAFNSHGVWWLNRFHESTATTVSYNSAGTWTANAITGLSSSYRHYMAVFKNKNSLCVSDGNTVKLYDTSYSLITTLTLPADFEVVGLAYNNYKMGVITRLGSDSAGQNAECYFFAWDGATTEASTGVGLGSYTSMCVFPYKSSFAVIDNSGRILYWNGGGFQELAHFPFFLEDNRWGDLLNFLSYGDNVVVDGDLILINVGFNLTGSGKKNERYLQNNPSGVWCYDPKVGLYHRTAPSLSRAYFHTISQANVDTSTNIFTTASTIPATGNPVLLTSGTVGGLSNGVVYYVIKLSSTTFSLASSYANAIVGTAVDITSADVNQYFFLYNIVDYGITHFTASGAIALYDTSTYGYKDYIFGGRYLNITALSSVVALCSNVPFLENRGYFVLARPFLNNILDTTQGVSIKHKALTTGDRIIVKTKSREIYGLPTIAPNGATSDEVIWTSSTECYSGSDLSEAYTAFNNGVALELELIAGAGAGQMVKITGISYGGGVYAFTLEDPVVGASSGVKSFFVVDNWEKKSEVNSDNQFPNGVFYFPAGDVSAAIRVKIELRGYNTTIEDIQIINSTHQK